MQMSKKKIKKAYNYLENPEVVHDMKKYIVLNELKDFGVYIDVNSDIDTVTAKNILFIILKRITDKYSKGVIK